MRHSAAAQVHNGMHLHMPEPAWLRRLLEAELYNGRVVSALCSLR